MSLNPPRRVILEVCIASVADACEAVAGGADRLELNVALELGGLTPSGALLAEVKRVVDVPVIVMIRPRGAGFVYRESEVGVMWRDAEELLARGADGIAWGALTPERHIDVSVCQAMVALSGNHTTVFHRAFDLVADPLAAARQLVDLGVRRILTSGQAPTAPEGSSLIARLRQQFAGSMEILPAGGVRPDNVRALLQRTGCDQVHGSFRRCLEDPARPVAESTYGVTDRQMVAAVRAAT
jgi:copper homeostasis protein